MLGVSEGALNFQELELVVWAWGEEGQGGRGWWGALNFQVESVWVVWGGCQDRGALNFQVSIHHLSHFAIPWGLSVCVCVCVCAHIHVCVLWFIMKLAR